MAALEYASWLFPDASITAIHVIDPGYEWAEGPGWTEDWRDQARARADGILDQAHDRAEEGGFEIDSDTLWGEPFRELLGHSSDADIDHIVMGSTGASSTGSIFLGGVAESVARRAEMPVTLVRDRSLDSANSDPHRVLTAIDGSNVANHTLEYALEILPAAHHVAVTVCESDIDTTADVTGTYLEEQCQRAEARARQTLDAASDIATARDIELETAIVFGRPPHAIIEFAEGNGIDHVFVGRRGLGSLRDIMLGSVAETVARRAPMCVTIYRA